ncbi:MAG TPA: PAS domain S-box protein [Rariglobus sp.]|jgi:PAS domain S-box-containing protein|nr:PAS domain S-box protein [Rariglobus sp.]
MADDVETLRAELAALKAECQRLRDERASDASHRRVRFEHNPLPMWVYDKQSLRFLDVNESAIRNYGYSREEFAAMTIRDIRSPEELPSFDAHLKSIPAGYSKSQRWRHYKKDGTPIIVDVFSDDITHESHDARLVVIVDVTERLQAEEALRLSEERFHLVSRATNDAVWDLNIVTGELWWSEGYYTLFGYDRTDTAPALPDWSKRIHSKDRARITESFDKAIAGDATDWTAEYEYQRKDGSYAVVQDRGHILRDASGKGIRMVGGMTDVTEHKKLLSQYLRAQRMESIGTLAGGVAHDLNNVLAPILMSIELLGMSATDEASKRLLTTIEKSARRGADLVRQVLTFARGIEGSRVAIKIDHLIKDVARIAEETFNRSIKTQVSFSRDLWAINGDATQLHQVLLNLAVNARDAMPGGGTLAFGAENVTIDAQYAGTSRDARPGPHICLSVSDTGCGIPSELLENIFEPFFTTKDVGQGTGLGLSTVHAIVKSHSGFVTVYSEIGKGSMFKVYLPADPSLQAPSSVASESAVARGRGETILVVDDEVAILTITQQTLEAFGYRVLVAHDGAEAIAEYAQHRDIIAAVITDMVMPIMDGPATINALMRINPQVLIIAASGLNANGGVAKVAGAGVKHFLPKPYTAEILLTALHNILHS